MAALRGGSSFGWRQAMAITYFKRFRMEIDLPDGVPSPALPEGFRWVAWQESLLEEHAEVKYRCFRQEIDAMVFPSLGNRSGCERLMREIRRKPGFLPAATWLIAAPDGYCATIQGVVDRSGVGAIQNVGVVPEFRGMGLGRSLVRQCLHGFSSVGLERVFLEVTAENSGAVKLYREVGFRKAKTLYKAVDG